MTINWQVETYDSLPSTQDAAKEKAQAGAEQGLVVQALEQTGGKGRHGREWVSPKGNLYLSILLRPECQAQQAGQLSFVAALALSAVLDEYLDDKSQKILKWPNDVLLAGKKCAGILLETELSENKVEWLVIGIGLNVVSAPDIGTALQDYTDKPLILDEIRDALLDHLGSYYALWRSKGFSEIRSLWLERAHKPGTELQIKLGERLNQSYFHDIDENGNLLLRSDSGEIQVITAGDVYALSD